MVQNEAEFSEMLYDALKQGDFALHAPTSRNFDLIRSIQYLLNGSGLYPTFSKSGKSGAMKVSASSLIV